MADLKFNMDHNKVAYLNKTKGSDHFHQIIDFLLGSNLQFALLENPTIYASLVR